MREPTSHRALKHFLLKLNYRVVLAEMEKDGDMDACECFQEIYDEIDKLEKTKIEELKYTSFEEKYRILLFIAGGLLVLEFILRNTLFRSFI